SASIIRAVDVFPLVPVMWIDGYARCGMPSRSSSDRMRDRSNSIRANPRASSARFTSSNSRLTMSSGSLRAPLRSRSDRVQRGVHPGQLGLGGGEPLADAGHHVLRRLGEERLVA